MKKVFRAVAQKDEVEHLIEDCYARRAERILEVAAGKNRRLIIEHLVKDASRRDKDIAVILNGRADPFDGAAKAFSTLPPHVNVRVLVCGRADEGAFLQSMKDKADIRLLKNGHAPPALIVGADAYYFEESAMKAKASFNGASVGSMIKTRFDDSFKAAKPWKPKAAMPERTKKNARFNLEY